MAPVPATITVNFIANYAGDHRVCWRTGGAGAYDCSTIVTCVGGGAACSATIAVSVDNETCDAVVFDGYVQATCEDVGSLSGRVPFTVTFTPNPTCDLYTVTCTSVAVESITVTNPGSGYTPGAPPVVSITGGGGSSATATAVVGDGGVKTWTITNGGSLYAPDAIYTNVPAITLTGVGTGAIFDVTVAGGIVTNLTLVDPGVDYAIADTFNFTDASLGGGGGGGVVITVDSVNTGEIQEITVTAGGSGYSSVPSATVPIGATQATLLVVLADCGTMNLGTDCDGNTHAAVPGIGLNEAVFVCTETPPVPGTGYVAVAEGCCYDCEQANFINDTGETQRLMYIDCTTREFVDTTILDAGTLDVCIVTGAFWYGGPLPTTTPGCAPL